MVVHKQNSCIVLCSTIFNSYIRFDILFCVRQYLSRRNYERVSEYVRILKHTSLWNFVQEQCTNEYVVQVLAVQERYVLYTADDVPASLFSRICTITYQAEQTITHAWLTFLHVTSHRFIVRNVSLGSLSCWLIHARMYVAKTVGIQRDIP